MNFRGFQNCQWMHYAKIISFLEALIV